MAPLLAPLRDPGVGVAGGWGRALEDRTRPLVKEVESLHTFLTVDMVRAVAHLDQVVNTRFTFAGFPLKLRGAHGGPTRAVALIG